MHTLFQINALALAGQQRRPMRTLVTLAGVAISIGTLYSLLSFQHGYQTGMQAELDHLGAHILVVPKGCPYDAASIALHGASWPCYLKESYLQQVQATSGVATAAPVFMSAVYDEGGSEAVYEGIDPSILRLKRGWKFRGRFPDAAGELLIGSETARRHGWRTGQAISLPGLGDQRGTVVGVLDPTQSPDDTFMFLRLRDAQQLFKHPRLLTHILVRLNDPDDVDRVVAQLHTCGAGMDMNVVPLAHLFQTLRSLISSMRLLLVAIALVALLVAGVGVSNTVVMSVVERTPEIGVMRALGASRGQIFLLFLLEAVQVCAVAGAVGIGGATACSPLLEAWLRSRLPFAPVGPLVACYGWLAVVCVGFSLFLGVLAALLPAIRAMFLSPIEAIRSQV